MRTLTEKTGEHASHLGGKSLPVAVNKEQRNQRDKHLAQIFADLTGDGDDVADARLEPFRRLGGEHFGLT